MVEESAGSEMGAEETPGKRRRGPGFILGLLMGALTGAAAATLLSPPEGGAQNGMRGDGEAQPTVAFPEGAIQGPPRERIREMLNRVRSRMREATDEGRVAAHEAEAASRARYAELVHRAETRSQREEYL